MANQFRKGIYPLDVQRTEYRLFPITASNGTNVFVGDVVKAITGSSASTPGSVAPATGTDYSNLVGTVVELFDQGGNTNNVPGMNGPVPIGMWASQVSTKYLPSSTAGYAMVAVAKPGTRFMAQASNIANAGIINKTTALVAGAGSTTTCVSGHTVNMSDGNGSYPAFVVLGPFNQLLAAAGYYNDITIAGALWVVEFAYSFGTMIGTAITTGV